jgi:hypothetical protein
LESDLDPRVKALKTLKDCENFARNARARGRGDLADQTLIRSIQIRAEAIGATTDMERDAIEAVFAYEEALSKKNGRRTRASRTWQMIKKHGVVGAVERIVRRVDETEGYRVLSEMGLSEFAWEAVVLRYPGLFSDEAIERSRARIGE